MEFLTNNGHRSAEMRPLWEQRLRGRTKRSAARAYDEHMTAVRDCVEMARAWDANTMRAANQFLRQRGTPP